MYTNVCEKRILVYKPVYMLKLRVRAEMYTKYAKMFTILLDFIRMTNTFRFTKSIDVLLKIKYPYNKVIFLSFE